MPLVEVIRTAKTSDEAFACALDFLKRLDKAAVAVSDGLRILHQPHRDDLFQRSDEPAGWKALRHR